MLKCSMAEVDLSPPLGLAIPGYFTRRNATGHIDDLYIKSLVVEKDNVKFAIIVSDSLCVDRDIVLDIRKKVCGKTGIKEENIMICATHTHTGTPVLSRYSGKEEEKYMKTYCDKAADSVELALASIREVKIGFGVGKEDEISFNRRFYMKDGSFKTNPGVRNPMIDRSESGIDPSVTVLKIEDLTGKIIGIVTNFACHPDVVGGNKYCADYPGELSGTLKKCYGQDVISLFINGACGNINHINVNNDPIDKKAVDHYRKMGRILGGEVIKVTEKIVCEDTGKIIVDIRSDIFPGKIRRPSKDEIAEAVKIITTPQSSETDRMFASYIVDFDYTIPEYAEVEVQVAKIGELAIAGFPGEVFKEFSDKVKKKSPFKYNMIGYLTNGNNGYLITRRALINGGYESKVTSRPRVTVQTGYEMSRRIVNILYKMSEN